MALQLQSEGSHFEPHKVPDVGTQPHYEAPSDLQIKIIENAVINIRSVKLSPQE